mmetsp:Transcript_10282/g.31436  ORF Transcript_10282/g.31436 Transcript_10282/m.31436 type:complete len:215 (-) Transcript_10282:42-686(-)
MLGSRARRSDLDLTLGGGLVSRFHSQVQSVLCVDCCTSYKISLYFLWRVEQLHVEVANGDRKSHNGLEHGKLVSYTLTGTAAKRQKRKVTDDLIGKQRFVSDCTAALPADHLWVLERARPSVRIKLVRVLPKVRRPMHIPHADENICPSRHLDRSLSSSLFDEYVVVSCQENSRPTLARKRGRSSPFAARARAALKGTHATGPQQQRPRRNPHT